MANSIDSENEVQDRPDQGHEPDEPHPCQRGAGIALVENHVPRRQRRKEQPKSDDGDVPGFVHQVPSTLPFFTY